MMTENTPDPRFAHRWVKPRPTPLEMLTREMVVEIKSLRADLDRLVLLETTGAPEAWAASPGERRFRGPCRKPSNG